MGCKTVRGRVPLGIANGDRTAIDRGFETEKPRAPRPTGNNPFRRGPRRELRKWRVVSSEKTYKEARAAAYILRLTGPVRIVFNRRGGIYSLLRLEEIEK